MEGLLFSQTVDQINRLCDQACNKDGRIFLFPVRHHSPACSFQLQKVIASYAPDMILIEGPEDANDVMRFLTHEETQPPVCLYCSYTDKEGSIGEVNGKYTCYYPLLDYSPEMVAMKMAYKRGVPALFMDLPYQDILKASKTGSGLLGTTPKVSYNDDYLIARSQYIEALCRKEQCRNFSEYWEKIYELDGLSQSEDIFIRNLLAFCYLSRVDQTHEMLSEDGCLAREAHMARRIIEAAGKCNRVLAVTGGFHTYGIMELIHKGQASPAGEVPTHKSGIYPMAYSMEECDQLSGYASGMPYPAFYQRVWESLSQDRKDAFSEAVLQFIVRCGGQMRKKTTLSLSDELEAWYLAKGLTALRGKSRTGVYELIDAVRTAYTKGELSQFDHTPLEVLNKLLIGRKVGKLCNGAELPPLVQDFRNLGKAYRLKLETTAEQDLILDIYKTPRHRLISQFLHMLLFMNTGFCKREKGPDIIRRTQMNLVRESWKYRWSPLVESTLIELSVYGGTMQEVTSELVKKRLSEIGINAGNTAALLVQVFWMGLTESIAEVREKVGSNIQQDGHFQSQVQCLSYLKYIDQTLWLLDSMKNPDMTEILFTCYYRCISLLSSIGSIPQEDEDTLLNCLKDLYAIAGNDKLISQRDLLTEGLLQLAATSGINSCVHGACLGLLSGLGRVEAHDVVKACTSYLYGTGEMQMQSAGFLKGLFSTARELLLYQEEFLEGIHHLLSTCVEEDFLKLIPDLRLSFGFFTPQEIDDIGKSVAKMFNMSKAEILETAPVDTEALRKARALDIEAANMMKDWGLLCGKE